MKLAVSNIAWTNDEETDIAKLLKKLGVKHIEIAPTKLWNDPTTATDRQIADYKSFWQGYGIEIVAIQSMLFNRPDLKLFESAQNRAETMEYLKKFITVAGKFGARQMVFGSPKNRQRGDMPDAEASRLAVEFFGELGSTAHQNGVCFCIEPNAPDYACDFVTNAQQGIKIVQAVGRRGFGLHLDIACMALAKDDIRQSIIAGQKSLKHFHVSSPMLEAVEDRPDIDHRAAASAIGEIDYNGFVSIEMRPGEPGQNLQRVEKAVQFAQSIYN